MTDSALLPERDQAAARLGGGPVTVLRDKWDEHAKQWIAWVRSPGEPDSYSRFHRKEFLELVPKPGRLTLDIGCGEGRVGRDLQAHGHTVLGVDWSRTMCEAAASHPKKPIPVVVGDAAMLPIADASVDCAVAFMSLQDIDDMRGAVTEIARVLADGKKLALAIVHPIYSGGKFYSDRGSKKNFVIKRSYFKPEVRVSQDSHDSLTVTFYREHRPLQAYIEALLGAGFIIEQLNEVTDKDESQPWHHVPMFLDVVATRKPRKEQHDSLERQVSVRDSWPSGRFAPKRGSKHVFVAPTSSGLFLTWPVTFLIFVAAIFLFAAH